jgi:hypothetical protein
MRSIPFAMTWDRLRHWWWYLIGFAVGANALPVLLFGALQHDGALEPGDTTSVMLHAVLVEINWLMFGVAVFGALGTPARLYTLPIRSSSIVLVQMVQGMVLIAIESVVSTALLNAAFGLRWPLLGPALFAAAGFASVLAVFRLYEKSGWVILVATAAVTAECVWFKSHDGPVFGTATRVWRVVTSGDLLTMGLMSVLAYGIAVEGVARNRCGQPPLTVGFLAWLARVFAVKSQTSRPFRSPERAQLWFEWRTKGWVMPATIAICVVAGFILWLIFSRDARALYAGLSATGGLIAFSGLLIGFNLGQVGGREPDLQIGQFLATRPATSTDIARSILKCAAQGLVIVWTIWAASLLALGVLLRSIQVTFPLRLPEPLGWWYLPAMLVGAWAAMGLSIPITLAGRKRLLTATVFSTIFLLLGLILFSKFAFSREGQEQFFRGTLAVGGALLLLGTVWAFLAAKKRALISAPTLAVAASVWGLLCALVAVHGMSHPEEGVLTYFSGAGILALAVSPLATAPLALAWNRNR